MLIANSCLQLEKNLLSCLNEAKGRILDDDNVINTLEILKGEAAEVGRKVDETDQVNFQINDRLIGWLIDLFIG